MKVPNATFVERPAILKELGGYFPRKNRWLIQHMLNAIKNVEKYPKLRLERTVLPTGVVQHGLFDETTGLLIPGDEAAPTGDKNA